MAGSVVDCLNYHFPCAAMFKALGVAIMIIVIAVLLPSVFQALEKFLLVSLDKATVFVQALPAPGTADLNQTFVR